MSLEQSRINEELQRPLPFQNEGTKPIQDCQRTEPSERMLQNYSQIK